MREEVWAIVRAAVAEATQPMIAKMRDIEAKLERAESSARTRPPPAVVQATPPPPAAVETGGSIPVLLGPSVAPPPVVAPAPPAMKVSVPPGVYGVAVLDPGPKKAEVDTSNVAPFEMPDFGGKSRVMAKVIAAVIVLAVAGAITATILSHA